MAMQNHFDSLDQVNNLREIQALRRLSPHPNIIKLIEVLYDQPTGRLALVFELMDMNIYEVGRINDWAIRGLVGRHKWHMIGSISFVHECSSFVGGGIMLRRTVSRITCTN